MDSQCANPLLLEWVGEWLQTARERSSKGVTTYKKAYDSLKACPIPFDHPSEAKQLKGLGDKLCARLTDKLTQHCQENGLPMPVMPHKRKKARKAPTDDEGDDSEGAPPPKRSKNNKPYVPKLRSGGYAIMMALATIYESKPLGITKTELIELAQPYSDSSFTVTDPSKHFTAWNSIRTLKEKDLVIEKNGSHKRYGLTDDGWESVQRMKNTLEPGRQTLDKSSKAKPSASSAPSFRRYNEDNDDDDDDDSIISEQGPAPRGQGKSSARDDDRENPQTADVVPLGNPSDSQSIPDFTPIILRPSTFTIHVVLDNREIQSKKNRDYIEDELVKMGLKPMKRSLGLGDALWIAKCKDPNYLAQFGAEGDEVMLDHILERKRLDDLISSIKEGRYDEQKFRLNKSGVKNVTYLIEEIALSQEHAANYEEAIESAIASMQVVDGYFVKKTKKIDESIKYLARMTRLLQSYYEGKALKVIPTKVITAQNYQRLRAHLAETEPNTDYYISYDAFTSLASKSGTLTLRDVYLKMLMCTSGVTGAKAMEIQKLWKTPYDLVKAYKNLGEGEEAKKRKEELVSSRLAQTKVRKKQIGKALSMKLAAVWGDVGVDVRGARD